MTRTVYALPAGIPGHATFTTDWTSCRCECGATFESSEHVDGQMLSARVKLALHVRSMQPAPRRSSCCEPHQHEALKLSAASWEALPLLGRQADGADGWLELRNCSCGSTLAIEVQS